MNDTCGEFETLIADFVDDGLDADRRATLERHLERCAACRELVGDVSAIRQAARRLAPLSPPRSLWSGIERAIRAADTPAGAVPLTGRRSRGTGTAGVPDPLKLAAALVLAAGTAVAIAVIGWRGLTTSDGDTSADDSMAVVSQVEADLLEAERHYEAARRGLEALSATTSDAGDADLAATLHNHLMLVDQMIAESRAALMEQPASKPAQASLFEGLRRKYALLQDAMMILDATAAEPAPTTGGRPNDLNRRL